MIIVTKTIKIIMVPEKNQWNRLEAPETDPHLMEPWHITEMIQQIAWKGLDYLNT